MSKPKRKAKVEFKGGPLNQQQRTQLVTGKHPGMMGCVTEAHRAGMHGVYRPDRTRNEEPFLLVWHALPRGDTRDCTCGCGGRI